MAKDVASNRKNQVDGFKSKFGELRSAFQAEGVVEVKITVLRVIDDLQNVTKNLNELGV